MCRALRFLTFVAAACLFAATAEAGKVTVAWEPNKEPNIARYLVGYRTSSTGIETLVDVGLATSWTLSTAVDGSTYYFHIYAENTSGLRSSPSQITAIIPYTPPSGGGLALNLGRLVFGVVKSGSTVTAATSAQSLVISQTAAGDPIAWTLSTSNWLRASVASGSGTSTVNISVAGAGLAAGTYKGAVSVKKTGTTTTLDLPVLVRVYSAGTTKAPTGYLDTPADGLANVAGAIPLTGWTVDDVQVSRVDVYRDPVPGEPGLIYLGTAAFVAGARPDIANSYLDSPMSDRSGWGLLVLTNTLPNLSTGALAGGNGTFRIHAFAVDAEGKSTLLGSRRFTASNAASTKPFGSIDTPAQGGIASGSDYLVFGWALSPSGTIGSNGSTISVLVDGVNVGHPIYNQYRSDIATLFPGYANSDSAVGYYKLDTTKYTNGLHTISWVVSDNAGNTSGIGSRYFTVLNGVTNSLTAAATSSGMASATASGSGSIGQSRTTVESVPADYSIVEVKRATSEDPTSEMVYPKTTGEVQVHARQTEPLEVHLANQFSTGAGGVYEGYLLTNGKMNPLPVGSALDAGRGVFRWEPGPGFVGPYEFVFLRNMPDGWKTRVPVKVTVEPKFDRVTRENRIER